ncbi:hypothetical protein WR25_26378 isoform A [Diploscapter pachys]|uniref:Uncharacterized protein n=1 Tax=Diploscapter pachys TaxID=2018661 RepID=A0A2A2JI44_9BILA|nr:hypothetical protein WR25_26378 isoform A [Diploscapter pachys]
MVQTRSQDGTSPRSFQQPAQTQGRARSGVRAAAHETQEDTVLPDPNETSEASVSETYSRLYPNLDEFGQSAHVEYQSDQSYLDALVNAQSTPINSFPLGLRERRHQQLFGEQPPLDGHSPMMAGNIFGQIFRSTIDSFRCESSVRPRASPSNSRRNSGANTENRLVTAMLVIGLFFILYLAYQYLSSEVYQNPEEQYKRFIEKAKHLIESKYGHLKKEDRKVLAMIGRKWLVERETPPISVVVTGPNAKEFATDLGSIAQELVTGSRWSVSAIEVVEKTERAILHDSLQLVLEQIKKWSNGDELRPTCATILDVNRLKWDALLVLHAFADGDAYPVKNTLLLISVDVNIDETNDTCENGLYKYFLKFRIF